MGEDIQDRRAMAGTGADPLPDEATVRQRVRALLNRGLLPGIRPSEIRSEKLSEQHDCTVCGDRIGAGEVGLELPSRHGVVVLAHRRCFDLWTQEAAEREADTDPV
jgi:hypothetical protein